MTGKLTKKIFINGTIVVKTGLAVGGGSIGLEIGGADKVVVRNPISNEPYIPGSSLKGKMRSLLEKLDGRFTTKTDNVGKISTMPCSCGTCMICKIFGVSAEAEGMPARLIVRDSELVNVEELEKSKNTDMPFTEVKTEVVIDRITSAATPRQFERVPAGAKFRLNLVFNIYEGDNETDMLKKVFEGLCLVQDDYLGGSGTRGYGQVKFNIESLTSKDQSCYENNSDAQILSGVTIPLGLQMEENNG